MTTRQSALDPERFTGFPEVADIGCEVALVGALVVNPTKVIDSVRDAVSGSEFFDAYMGAMFDAIIALYDRGVPVSEAGLLISNLRAMKSLDVPDDFLSMKATGLPLLIEKGSAWWHAKHYADTIREAARLRKLMLLAAQVEKQVKSRGAVSNDISEWLQQQLEGSKPTGESVIETIGETARKVVLEFSNCDGPKKCLFTGLEHVDEAVTLLMPGEMVVLAARPGCGKTSLAQQIGIHNARRDRKVLFASIEMEAPEIARRELSAATGVSDDEMRRNEVGQRELLSLADAAEDLQHLPFTIYRPKKKPTARKIRTIAKSVKRTKGCDLLIVDYIGEIRAADTRKDRVEQVTQITEDLKETAVELGVPLIALCQLNRGADKERPTLGNLRESGAIEQIADAVMFLHRDAQPGYVELILAKNRHGSPGEFWLRFDGPRTRFFPSEAPPQQVNAGGSKFSKFRQRRAPEPPPPPPARHDSFDEWNGGSDDGDN